MLKYTCTLKNGKKEKNEVIKSCTKKLKSNRHQSCWIVGITLLSLIDQLSLIKTFNEELVLPHPKQHKPR